MATLAQNLRTVLTGDATLAEYVGARVHHNYAPDPDKGYFIYYAQTGNVDDMALDDSAGQPTRTQFAVEIHGDDIGTVRTIANRCQSILHKKRGAFGDQTVQGVFAENMADDYMPKAVQGDQVRHWAALALEVVL